MKCQSCSATNSQNSKFCSSCGTALTPTVNPSNLKQNLSYLPNDKSQSEGINYRKLAVIFPTVLIVFVGVILATGAGSGNKPETAISTSPSETYVDEEKAPEAPTATLGELNAVRKAEVYISMGGFSKKGLIEQLKYEGFTAAESKYGVENIVVNWDEQAAIKAETYMRVQAFSANGLIAQLIYEGFTERQAAYGAYMVGFRP